MNTVDYNTLSSNLTFIKHAMRNATNEEISALMSESVLILTNVMEYQELDSFIDDGEIYHYEIYDFIDEFVNMTHEMSLSECYDHANKCLVMISEFMDK